MLFDWLVTGQVVATNPAHSWINQNQLKDILDRLDFLVVQDYTLPAPLSGNVLGNFSWERTGGTLQELRQHPITVGSWTRLCMLISLSSGEANTGSGRREPE